MNLKFAALTMTVIFAGLVGWAAWGARLSTRDQVKVGGLKFAGDVSSHPVSTLARPASRGRQLESERSRPNFVVLVMDDADYALFHHTGWQARFPNFARLAALGMTFTNCHVTTPKCCPSRASFFRGQYASKLGITGNNSDPQVSNGFPGGYGPYRQRGYDQDDLPVWLRRAGYRTMLVGKYLHNDFDFVVPPGWSDFYCSLGNRYFGTSRFTTATNPAGSHSRLDETEHRTRREAEDARALIDAHQAATAEQPQPFFLYLAPLGPHDPAPDLPRAEQRYADAFATERAPRPANFNEADISDKPSEMQRIPRLDAEADASIDELYRERLRAVKSIDDLAGEILETLVQHDLVDQTYLFVTSDHGYLLGEHRVTGKGVPYNEASRVPLLVSGPGIAVGQTADHLLAHFDVTATLLELAGLAEPEFIDGKSFVPLLANPQAFPADQWRHSLLLEHWEASTFGTDRIDTAFVGLRTYRESYIEWAQGESEYYDLEKDSAQMTNRIGSLPGGAREFLGGMMRILRQDGRSPLATTVGALGAADGGIPANSRIFGFADDDTGVQRVRIVVWDPATALYWNGSNWQMGYVQLTPTLSRPQGLLTRWEYSLNLANQLFAPQARIMVAARAVDVEGNVSAGSPGTTLTIDASPPETVLTRPVRNDRLGNPARIYGSSTDNIAISRIQVTLRNLADNSYWNGSGWQETRTVVETRVATTGKWHYFPPLPPGRYGIWVRAIDTASNFDPTPASAVFTVE